MSLSRSATWVVAPRKHLAFLSFQSSQATNAKMESASRRHCPIHCLSKRSTSQEWSWHALGVFLTTLIECTTRLAWSRSNPRWYGQWILVLGRIGNNCSALLGHVASAGLLSNDTAWGLAKGIVWYGVAPRTPKWGHTPAVGVRLVGELHLQSWWRICHQRPTSGPLGHTCHWVTKHYFGNNFCFIDEAALWNQS
jgi:hypothetical protein